MARGAATTIVSAADAGYFSLLQGLVLSLRQARAARGFALSILDLGLAEDQRRWLTMEGAALVQPGWDVDFPGRSTLPEHYKAMTARPHLPRHFPGYEVYLWIDADAWVQDAEALDIFVRGAQGGALAIVPEIDRGYWTIHKRPKPWGQNQKAFAWAFGWRAGYRLGRNAILNVGAFALRGDAPHWRLWAAAHARALRRKHLFGARGLANPGFFLSEQTALNHVVYAEGARATYLPAYCNWFCGKGTPMFDGDRRRLVEPHEPHHPLGIVHLAGAGMKDRAWRIATLEGGAVETLLTYAAVAALAAPPPPRDAATQV